MLKLKLLSATVCIFIFLSGCLGNLNPTKTDAVETLQPVKPTTNPTASITQPSAHLAPTLSQTPLTTDHEGPSQKATSTPETSPLSSCLMDKINFPDFRLYGFSFQEGYWARRFPYEWDIISGYISNQNPVSGNNGPGNADLISFANFADRMVYWVRDGVTGTLYISDLMDTNPSLIFVDDQGRIDDVLGGGLHLVWTPDDLHLILETPRSVSGSMLINVTDDTIEPWPYKCDILARSPRSNFYAVWCKSVDDPDVFAVIEWGWQIWQSNTPPEEILIENNSRLDPLWSWDAQGKRIAFFDEGLPGSPLTIISVDGTKKIVLSYAAYWSAENYISSDPGYPYLTKPLQWSQDGRRLLIYAKGGEENPCPQHNSLYNENDQLQDQACWQVIDPVSGKIIWPTPEIPYETFFSSIEELQSAAWSDATITPDGQFLALYYWDPLNSQNMYLIIDLKLMKASPIPMIHSNTIRWGK